MKDKLKKLRIWNKILLHLVGNNREKLEETLTTEQAELFEKYYTATNEMNSVSETEAFEFGFNLAVWLLIVSIW